MNELLIPEYWLTGLGSWAVSYVLHSSVILGVLLLLTYLVGALSESNKDVLLKIGLIAGMLSASLQFVQSSNGIAVSTIAMSLNASVGDSTHSIMTNATGRILVAEGLQVLVPEPIIEQEQPLAVKTNWLQVFLLAWLVCSLLFAIRFFWLWQRFKQTIGHRKLLQHEQTLALCQRLQNNMGLSAKVKLTCSSRLVSPMAIGLHEVCIPDGLWNQVDNEQLTAIIAHELAHLARKDPIWLFFWHLMGIVFFFQPLNKITQLSFQSRAEFLADATAVRQTKDPVAMVNSLMTAAKLLNGVAKSNLAPPLLGNNATIVARSQRLLSENLLNTRTPVLLIIIAAAMIVSASTYYLPSVSLISHDSHIDIPAYGQLNQNNALPWTEFSDTRMSFQSNIDHNQSKAGVRQMLRTRLVTFDYHLDGISDIERGGQLRFVSQSIYGSRFLVIERDWSGKAWYQFHVDGELVDNQKQADLFIQQMLDSSLGQSDEFKRRVMPLYVEQGSYSTAQRIEAEISRQLNLAINTTADYLTEKEFSISRKLLEQAQVFSKGGQYDETQGLVFFNAMAHSSTHMASFNDFGYLAISPKRKTAGGRALQYNLNNPQLLQLFAKAQGSYYQPGKTEKALVHFLVRLYFKVPQAQIQWLEE